MSGVALSEENLDLLLEKMYAEKGWDFRRYRKSSIKRCVEKQIALSRHSYPSYIKLLDSEPLEYNNLFNHITIKVSEFFRNPEVYNCIEDHVIPVALQRLKTNGKNILRVWSCGCARGDEPYSMAILLAKRPNKTSVSLQLTKKHENTLCHPELPCHPDPETSSGVSGSQNEEMLKQVQHDREQGFSGENKEDYKIKIFATDIDEGAVDIARKGIFGKESLTNVHPILRQQFFQTAGNNFQVAPQIRNLVTFGVHNVVSHIHLSHMDIILCRNLLIYFEKELQERVFEKFYYSLDRGGFIILGRSEAIPLPYRDRFQEVFKKEKIYQKF